MFVSFMAKQNQFSHLPLIQFCWNQLTTSQCTNTSHNMLKGAVYYMKYCVAFHFSGWNINSMRLTDLLSTTAGAVSK